MKCKKTWKIGTWKAGTSVTITETWKSGTHGKKKVHIQLSRGLTDNFARCLLQSQHVNYKNVTAVVLSIVTVDIPALILVKYSDVNILWVFNYGPWDKDMLPATVIRTSPQPRPYCSGESLWSSWQGLHSPAIGSATSVRNLWLFSIPAAAPFISSHLEQCSQCIWLRRITAY